MDTQRYRDIEPPCSYMEPGAVQLSVSRLGCEQPWYRASKVLRVMIIQDILTLSYQPMTVLTYVLIKRIGVMNFQMLRRGQHPGLFGWVQCNPRIPQEGGRRVHLQTAKKNPMKLRCYWKHSRFINVIGSKHTPQAL